MPTLDTILPNEKELFARMSGGDETAFTKIFHHYTQGLYQYILFRTRSEDAAEEIVQEIFIKLWVMRNDLDTIENHRSYIYRMAANNIANWFKKVATETNARKKAWESMSLFTNDAGHLLDLHLGQQRIHNAVTQLPPQRKKIFLMSREEGLTRSEIAEQLNLSVSTVNNQLNEAIRFIREYLKKEPGASVPLLLILLKIYP